MIIGIPKESWRDERRVALTPAGVYALAKAGHTVIVQSDAGAGSGFSMEAYDEAGATIAFSAEEVFARADLVVKVMPPTVEECQWIPDEKFLFSWVQLGVANPTVHQTLMQRRATAVGYELIEDDDQNLPVLTAMSEIAGLLLPQIAGRFLETTHGGRGISLGGVAGIPASNVVIIGAGIVGSNAARSFLGVGANVIVLDADLRRLRQLEMLLNKMVNTAPATPYNIERYVEFADVVAGSVLIHGRKAPHVLTEAMVRKMKPGSVILDVSIDQGGCVETSRPTTLSDPVFKLHGVIHYCVPNIPSSVARTASHALNNVVLSFVEDIAEDGLAAFRENSALRRGVYIYRGQCTYAEMAGLFGWEYFEVNRLVKME
jgi:alanine dehydrogenase